MSRFREPVKKCQFTELKICNLQLIIDMWIDPKFSAAQTDCGESFYQEVAHAMFRNK